MATECKTCDAWICDFCKHYIFNDEWCQLHQAKKDPADGCDQFYCVRAEADPKEQP